MTPNELADDLNIKASMINLGEKIAWGSDSGIMDAAATMLRQFDLAESIIKQQQIEIEALKDEVAKWKMSYENSIRFEDGYGHN